MSLRARLGVQRGHFTVDVDLTVEPGHTLAILGPNGAGKTTILHALAGLAHLDDGHITVDETTWATPETDLPPEKRSVGLLAADRVEDDVGAPVAGGVHDRVEDVLAAVVDHEVGPEVAAQRRLLGAARGRDHGGAGRSRRSRPEDRKRAGAAARRTRRDD